MNRVYCLNCQHYNREEEYCRSKNKKINNPDTNCEDYKDKTIRFQLKYKTMNDYEKRIIYDKYNDHEYGSTLKDQEDIWNLLNQLCTKNKILKEELSISNYEYNMLKLKTMRDLDEKE